MKITPTGSNNFYCFNAGGTAISFEKRLPGVNQKSVEKFVNQISKETLMLHLNKIASPETEGRGVGQPGIEIAKKYIAQEFEKIGLKPVKPLKLKDYFENFMLNKYKTYVPMDSSKYIDGQIDRLENTKRVKTSNILGMIKGKKYPNDYVILTAHYDHLGKTSDGIIFPGADDNASGVSGLLEIARVMNESGNNKRSVIFAVLSGEEYWQDGAKKLAKQLKKARIANKVEIFNIDMIGGKGGNILDVWKEKASLSKNILEKVKQAGKVLKVKIRTHLNDVSNIVGVTSSDAGRFMAEGINSVSVAWDSSSKAKYLHTTLDTIENINPDVFTKATKTVGAVSYLMANAAPKKIY